jgi:hypothetical protein
MTTTNTTWHDQRPTTAGRWLGAGGCRRAGRDQRDHRRRRLSRCRRRRQPTRDPPGHCPVSATVNLAGNGGVATSSQTCSPSPRHPGRAGTPTSPAPTSRTASSSATPPSSSPTAGSTPSRDSYERNRLHCNGHQRYRRLQPGHRPHRQHPQPRRHRRPNLLPAPQHTPDLQRRRAAADAPLPLDLRPGAAAAITSEPARTLRHQELSSHQGRHHRHQTQAKTRRARRDRVARV